MVNVYVGESSPVFSGGFHSLFAIAKPLETETSAPTHQFKL